MSQILVPITDQAAGLWTTTPLWSKVDDDSTVNPTGDGTVITSNNNTNPDNADFKISSGTDPAVSTGHVLRARWNKSASVGHTINAVLELWQGVPGSGTLIATLTVAGIGEVEVGSTLTLSGAQADSITDYTDLYLRLSRQGDTGGPGGNRRSLIADLVELEIPEGALIVAIGQAVETDLAQPLTGAKVLAIGQAVEANTALAVAAVKSYQVGQATEVDTAQPVAHEGEQALDGRGPQARIVGAAGRTRRAIIFPAQVSVGIVVIGQATEVDMAQPIGAAKTLVIGQAVETDLAQPVTARKAYQIGQAVETSVAQSLTAEKTRAIGQAVEVDMAQPVSTPGEQIAVIGQAVEVDLAQPLGAGKTQAVGIAVETDTAQALTHAIARAIGQGIETDTAQAITAAKLQAIGQALEIDTAGGLSARKSYPIGQAIEVDTAQAVLTAVVFAIGTAVETDTAFAVTSVGGLVVVHIEGSTIAILVDRGFAIAELTPSKSEALT